MPPFSVRCFLPLQLKMKLPHIVSFTHWHGVMWHPAIAQFVLLDSVKLTERTARERRTTGEVALVGRMILWHRNYLLHRSYPFIALLLLPTNTICVESGFGYTLWIVVLPSIRTWTEQTCWCWALSRSTRRNLPSKTDSTYAFYNPYSLALLFTVETFLCELLFTWFTGNCYVDGHGQWTDDLFCGFTCRYSNRLFFYDEQIIQDV